MTFAEWTRAEVFIDGVWRTPYDGRTVDVENPATETVVGTAADAGAAEADDAVAAARRAFDDWSRRPLHERLALLEDWYAALERRRDLLIATTIAEVGAPRRVAEEAHVETGLAVLHGYLDAAGQVAWEERVGNSLVLREGAGVAACITPWNYALYQVLAKVGGALVAGSTVVLKPSELTPLSAYLLTDAALEARLPRGVFNLVPGAGRLVGEALVTHGGVDVVSFTGSTGVGARVAAQAAQTVKRVCLELGGKSASVVLPGADLATAVRTSVHAAMLNSGQTCTAWSRLLIPRDLLDGAVELAAEAAGRLVVGDPTYETTDIGPVISAAQRESVLGFLQRAADAGATIAAGGVERPAGMAHGHFVRPTIVTDLKPNAEIVLEEVFGPVLTVQAYEDEAEALAMANGTDFGLAGAVWAADTDTALSFARGLRTGQVDLNGASFNPSAPFGGYRHSGNGRELGRWGIEEFLEIKSVQL